MLVREIMTTPVLTLYAEDRPQEALRLMSSAHVTALPVVSGSGSVVGMISEADLLRPAVSPDARARLRYSAGSGEPLPQSVGELMTSPAHTVRPESDVADVAVTLCATGWKSMPVVRDDALVGMVSRSDVVRALWRTDAQIRADVDRRLHDFDLIGLDARVVDGVVTISGEGSDTKRRIAAAVASGVRGVRRVEACRRSGTQDLPAADLLYAQRHPERVLPHGRP